MPKFRSEREIVTSQVAFVEADDADAALDYAMENEEEFEDTMNSNVDGDWDYLTPVEVD